MSTETTTGAAQRDLPALRLELFGGPLVWRHGRTVRISPLQTGLLGLAFGDSATRIPRASVQRLLWESHDDRVLRHRLSQLIYQMNRTVAARVLEPDGEHIRVHRHLVACDVDDYLTLTDSEDFAKACDMLERGFLAACHQRRTAALADWIEEQRIHKRLHLRRAALAVWEKAEAAHDWSRARRASEVLLRLDPREETILRRVMRARVMAGQVREAEAIYWSFAERIDPSGEWMPEPATSRLLKNVREAYRRSAQRSDRAAGSRDDPALVGRSSELAELTRSLYRSDGSGSWRTIAVCGEAGVGKTRLVREVIKSARFRGYRVIETSTSRLESEIALGPLLEPLSEPWVLPFLRTLTEPWRSAMLSMLPELQEGMKRFRDAPLSAVAGVSRHMCEGFLRLFTAIAESGKTIFFMDAFHWADDATIAVLEFLRRRWNNSDFTLLTAYCEEELRPDHMVTRFLQEEDQQAIAIRLTELDDAAAVKLVRSVATVDAAESRLARLTRTAGGNPRFLIDLASSATDEVIPGDFHEHAAVPPSVRQVVSRRLARLDDTARSVAFGLAVLGRTTSVDRLSVVSEDTRAKCLNALDRLHRLRLVDWTPQGVRFRYDVFGQAVYQQIHPSRRAVLHARTAEVLGRASPKAPPLEVARHYALAGRPRLASMCALEAVQQADAQDVPSRFRTLLAAYELSEGSRRRIIAASLSRTCYDLNRLGQTIRFGVEALQDGKCLQPSESVVVQLAVAKARHKLNLADTETSLAETEEIEERAQAVGDAAILAAVVETRVEILERSGMRDAVVRQLALLRAMDVPAQPTARCRILSTLAIEAGYGNPDSGLRAGREAVDLTRAQGLSDEMLPALVRYTEALMACGLLATAQGWETLSNTTALAAASGHQRRHVLILLALAEWHIVTGNYEIADRVLDETRALTREMDCPETRTREHLVRGALAVSRGDLDEGRARLNALIDVECQEGDQKQAAVPGRLADELAAFEGTLLLELGQLGRVSQIAERHPLGESLAEAPLGLILFHARLRSRTGDFSGARELLALSLEANASIRPLVWLRLSLELVRLARRIGNPQPQLAKQARDRGTELGLSGLAHEFQPYCDD